MKKFLMIPLLSLVVAGSAVAALDSVSELNLEIQKILQPYQNTQTEARLAFANIETNAERALSVGLTAFYEKVGTQNTLSVDIQNLSYTYGDGSAPTTSVQGSIGLDLTKLLPQDQINEIIPNVEAMINDAAKNYGGQYGDALTVVPVITEREKDEAGNYVGVKGSVTFAFDFAKLPAGTSALDIPVSSGTLTLSVNVKKGATIDAKVVSNTGYKGFAKDGEGLKEALDMLLKRDENAMGAIKSLADRLEELAGQVVNGQQN